MSLLAQSQQPPEGVLYVVATPIGNFDDISERALQTLRNSEIILAEDTRRTLPLLQRFVISKPIMQAFHEHNEAAITPKIIDQLLAGKKIALVSDAGTPLISDPGYSLVMHAHERRIRVQPIPGSCALIAALSASGLPTDQFFFAGFLPAKSSRRTTTLEKLKSQVGTLVFYESSHRILGSLQDCLAVLGNRQAVIAREMTKLYETIRLDTLSSLIEFVSLDSNQQKGEFVVLIEGAQVQEEDNSEQIDHVLIVLLEELPVKQAVSIASKILGMKKNAIYQRALQLK